MLTQTNTGAVSDLPDEVRRSRREDGKEEDEKEEEEKEEEENSILCSLLLVPASGWLRLAPLLQPPEKGHLGGGRERTKKGVEMMRGKEIHGVVAGKSKKRAPGEGSLKCRSSVCVRDRHRDRAPGSFCFSASSLR